MRARNPLRPACDRRRARDAGSRSRKRFSNAVGTNGMVLRLRVWVAGGHHNKLTHVPGSNQPKGDVCPGGAWPLPALRGKISRLCGNMFGQQMSSATRATSTRGQRSTVLSPYMSVSFWISVCTRTHAYSGTGSNMLKEMARIGHGIVQLISSSADAGK